jgi:hypothetical protein
MCFYKGEETEKKNLNNLLKIYFTVNNKYLFFYYIVTFWQMFQYNFAHGLVYFCVGG